MTDHDRIARWMGWEYYSPKKSGMSTGDPPHWRIPNGVYGVASKMYRAPPYHTDWRLTGPLLEKLMHRAHGGWIFSQGEDGIFTGDKTDSADISDYVTADTLPAAICAAAVAQIEGE